MLCIYHDYFPHCYPPDFISLCVLMLFKTGQESQCENNNQEKNNAHKPIYFFQDIEVNYNCRSLHDILTVSFKVKHISQHEAIERTARNK